MSKLEQRSLITNLINQKYILLLCFLYQIQFHPIHFPDKILKYCVQFLKKNFPKMAFIQKISKRELPQRTRHHFFSHISIPLKLNTNKASNSAVLFLKSNLL
jgi:hypothetical protein